MKRLSNSIVASLALSLTTACSGAGDEDLTQDSTNEVASTTQTLGSSCGIEPNGNAYCAQTGSPLVGGRKVFYRVGVNSGPGYDVATGRHSAVVLFQGTSDPPANGAPIDTGGNNGPGTAWSNPIAKPGPFGSWHQIATVIALINAGYTVLQPAARQQPGGGFFWDTNRLAGWNPSPDRTFMTALIAAMQPSSTTFGSLDVNHFYAMGISSGGYMSSRIAHEYAGGVNNNSQVLLPTTKPFRAVAIESAGYQGCGANLNNERPFMTCIAILQSKTYPATHAPVFFLHGQSDMVVPIETMTPYRTGLDKQFPNENPAYTVNGVRQEFTRFTGAFPFTTGPKPGHQWSLDLTPDSTNPILVWFNEHR